LIQFSSVGIGAQQLLIILINQLHFYFITTHNPDTRHLHSVYSSTITNINNPNNNNIQLILERYNNNNLQ